MARSSPERGLISIARRLLLRPVGGNVPEDKRYADARLEELEFLMGLAENAAGWHREPSQHDDSVRRRTIASLIYDGLINDIGTVEVAAAFPPEGQHFGSATREHSQRAAEALDRLLDGQEVSLSIGHRGLLRIVELRQQLQSGRDRDPTKIMISKRHLETDLTLALLRAGKDHPLAVALFDMNGLKKTNDDHGHAAGDEAIRTYLSATAMVIGTQGEAYRGDGGDEVCVILPDHDEEKAATLARDVLTQLAKERTQHADGLFAACGVFVVRDSSVIAEDLIERVDTVQYRAKDRSKSLEDRPSVLVVGEGEIEVIAVGE